MSRSARSWRRVVQHWAIAAANVWALAMTRSALSAAAIAAK